MSTPPAGETRYVIGIDLGTTNSAVAYVDLKEPSPRHISFLDIPQLIGPGQMGSRPVLPSFLYLPGPYELPPEARPSPGTRIGITSWGNSPGNRAPWSPADWFLRPSPGWPTEGWTGRPPFFPGALERMCGRSLRWRPAPATFSTSGRYGMIPWDGRKDAVWKSRWSC